MYSVGNNNGLHTQLS